MPSTSDNETALLVKKNKKNKKTKVKTEPQEEEENGTVEAEVEAPVEESPKKNKKNKKQKEVKEEVVEEEEEVAAPVQNDEAEEEEEEEMQQSQPKSQQSNYEMDHSRVNEVVKSLNDVNADLIEQFRATAEKVVKKHNSDPVAPLAAAIAVLSGATKVITNSLLTQREVIINKFKHF